MKSRGVSSLQQGADETGELWELHPVERKSKQEKKKENTQI